MGVVRREKEREASAMSYYGGQGDGGGAQDVFVKTAVEIKRFLPSLFNIKVVRLLVAVAKGRQSMNHEARKLRYNILIR